MGHLPDGPLANSHASGQRRVMFSAALSPHSLTPSRTTCRKND